MLYFCQKEPTPPPPNLPIFLLGGAKDSCTNSGTDMIKLHKNLIALGNKQTTCKILEGTRHESLNEINREQTSQLFLNWINERIQVSA